MKMLANAILVAAFLGLGIWIGPYLRGAYERWFPEPAYVTGDYADLHRQTEKAVVLFSTSTCPYCQKTRELLAEEHVDYRDFVVDRSADAEREFKALGGGGVPQLFVGNRRITGFRPDAIRESLALIEH